MTNIYKDSVDRRTHNEQDDDLPLAFLQAPMADRAPQTACCLEKLGWDLDADSGTITRRMNGFSYVFYVGYDGLDTLRSWLIEHWTAVFSRNCGRLNQKTSRAQNAGFANGLMLPSPPSGLVVTGAHKQWFNKQHDIPAVRMIAVGTGLSFWYLRSACSKTVPDKCMCGGWQPIFAHLMWNCPSTAHITQNIPRPTNRAEERTLCRV